MPRKILPRIVAVTADAAPMTLRVRWDNGEESRVDVSGMIESFRVYAPLRQSPGSGAALPTRPRWGSKLQGFHAEEEARFRSCR